MGTELWRAHLEDLKARVEQDFGADNVSSIRPSRRSGSPATGAMGLWCSSPNGRAELRRGGAKPRVCSAIGTSRSSGDATSKTHLTDLVKHFPGTGVGQAELIKSNWPYFLEELTIVDAKIVVAVGGAVHRRLKGRIPQSLYLMPHYAYRYGPVAELRKKLDDSLVRVEAARSALADA